MNHLGRFYSKAGFGEDDASLPSGGFSDINPLELIASLETQELKQRTTGRLTESPTSVQHVNLDCKGSGGENNSSVRAEKTLSKSSQSADESDSHSRIFQALDRILSYSPEDEEEEGIEVDNTATLKCDHIRGPKPSMLTVRGLARSHNQLQAQPTTIPFGDARVFCLGLVGHGHVSIPATIVQRSLERHFDFVHTSKKEELGGEVQMLIISKKYEEACAIYSTQEGSIGRSQNLKSASALTWCALLNTMAGNKEASLVYAKRLLRLNRSNSDQADCGISLVLLGLVYLRFGRVEKAVNTWREALQIVILVFGYDHTHVAMLLNNLGCLHYLLGDFATSLQLFSESVDLNRTILRTSSEGTDTVILDISLAKGNIAMILARNDKCEVAGSLLEEVLSLQESMIADRAHRLAEETKVAMERVLEKVDTGASTVASVATSSKFFDSKSEFSQIAAIQRSDTFQHISIEESKTSIFGNGDGIPMRRSGNIDAIDASDNLDTLLLGSLAKEYTPKQRVRAAVLLWFDKTLQDEERDPRLPFVPFQSSPRKRSRIPIDLDTSEAIDAELHLQEIIEQAVDHLEHDEIEEALELFESSLYSHKGKYGNVHHLVGMAIHNIGMVYLYAQRYSLALKSFQKAVTVRQAALGSEHPAVAASLMKIGMIFLLQNNPDGAKEAFYRTIQVIRKSMGYSSIQMARILNNLGVAHYDAGSYSKALQSFCEARDIQLNLLKMAESEGAVLKAQKSTIELAVTNSLSNLGFLHCKESNHMESYRLLQEANKLRKKHGGIFAPDHHCLEENLTYVGGIVREMGPEQRVQVSEPDRNPLEKLLDSVLGRMRCMA